MTIIDSEGASGRGCPRHAVAALDGITGAHVDWPDSTGLNQWERKALELAEERSQLRLVRRLGPEPPTIRETSEAGYCQGRLTPKRPGGGSRTTSMPHSSAASCAPTARRVGDGDVEALVLMLGLADEIDAAIGEAVKGLRNLRLLLGRDRLPARHHPPGRAAALGATVSTGLRYADKRGR